MDRSRNPDERARLILAQMTLDEKLGLVSGLEAYGKSPDPRALGGAGFVPGIPRLGLPHIQMTDGRSGVANAGSRYATALPSSLAAAASWDLKVAHEYGSLLGKETRDLGFHVSLGGTANLVRDPRNGRNFETWGEDPILTGRMLGRALKATQEQGVVGNINRYGVESQEHGRLVYSSTMERRVMRQTDLLAFEIAIRESAVGTVMCAYSRLNGDYCCENSYLLNDLLKKKWGYQGWVMSDWGAVHSTVKSALAGLDQEMPTGRHFGPALKKSIEQGHVPVSRVDDMVHRILRTGFAIGIFDELFEPRPVNPFTGAEVAQRVAEQSIVLLKNADRLLPLKRSGIRSIAVIGGHADVGVLSGSGADQVVAAGGSAVPIPAGYFRPPVWHPSSPLKAIRAKTGANVQFHAGDDVQAAARLAANSDVAIVFVYQHAAEGRDAPNLSLPDGQDQLVSRVAAANPRTIVVLETGGPVTMPWIEKAGAVLEAWYPGIRGGEAIASVLFGDANPSGRLPVTFPKSEADLPRPVLPGAPKVLPLGEVPPATPFEIQYAEGLKVGYKWFEAEAKTPLFPFGFGLSYTTFSYSNIKVGTGAQPELSFRLVNTGKRAGAETAQVYVSLPSAAGEPFRRLVAWEKVQLGPGEAKTVTLRIDPLYLSVFDVEKDDWRLLPGDYKVFVGSSAQNLPLTATVHLGDRR
jgi:beta-glucosidase